MVSKLHYILAKHTLPKGKVLLNVPKEFPMNFFKEMEFDFRDSRSHPFFCFRISGASRTGSFAIMKKTLKGEIFVFCSS